MTGKPAIVVSAYNREASLQRLLRSLQEAHYAQVDITLVISIDKSASTGVLDSAASFEWTHGEKRIIAHEQHLGLKAHILACGDLSAEYGSVIVLEDDLAVSTWFYDYAVQAMVYYADDLSVAGISLYNYETAESDLRLFQPVDDGSDVYFVQAASSWGQLWTARQWRDFRSWLSDHAELSGELPAHLYDWGKNSWKKHFNHYLVDRDNYFVFPRLSLSTNFEEPGTNADGVKRFNVPLQLLPKKYAFIPSLQSGAVYDAWFEILPRCLNRLNASLSAYDYSVDLRGIKSPEQLRKEYVLTGSADDRAMLQFGAGLLPPEANAALNRSGRGIGLFSIADAATLLRSQDQLNGNYEGVSVVIPVTSFDSAGLSETLRSIDQQHGKKECVVAATQVYAAQVEEVLSGLNLSARVVEASPGAGPGELLALGLMQARRQIVTWVHPGAVFSESSFEAAAAIFNGYAGISWIRGIEELPDAETGYSKVRTLRYRLNRAEVYHRLKNNLLEVNTDLHFFRKSCVEKCIPQRFTETAFFFALISSYELYVAVTRFGDRGSAVKSIPEDRGHLLTSYAHFKKQVRLRSRFTGLLLKTPFLNDGSWQWYLPSVKGFPDVLRFDAVNGTFYPCKY